MKTYIITGACGFIGSSLCKKLLELGHKVYGVDVKSNDIIDAFFSNPNFEFIVAGYDDYAYMRTIDKVDYVIHIAWSGVSGNEYKNIDSQLNNIKGAINILNYCHDISCSHFVFIDSSHEYQKNINSSNEVGFCSLYGSSKKATSVFLDTIGHNLCVDVFHIAFTNVYGPGDYSYRSTNIILTSLINNGFADLIEGNNLHDWTYIDDAIGGIVAILERGKPWNLYYVGERNLVSFREIVKKANSALPVSGELRFGKYKDSSFIDYSFFDLEKLYNDTGFSCSVSVEEGTKRTVAWLQKIGRI